MLSVPRPRQGPRAVTQLHGAAIRGSTEHAVALLSDESIDIDALEPRGGTPLMMAACMGHPRVVRILLDKGANVSVADDLGNTDLYLSVEGGSLAVSKMLLDAGADVKAVNNKGNTPLLNAAQGGQHEMVGVMIEAGANPNSRSVDGATPLFIAAALGRMDTLKMLLRAKANPLLTRNIDERQTNVPLDTAAECGHLEVVRELVNEFGIDGCGGAGMGVDALQMAAKNQHVDIMAVLTDAGVVDSGMILAVAVMHGRPASVNFLLLQRKGDGIAYVNVREVGHGATPLLIAIGVGSISSPSPIIVRLLVGAGADTTSTVQVTNKWGDVVFKNTPLFAVTFMLCEKVVSGTTATEEQLHRLERIRRLLLQVEAVHAVSWLWPVDVPATTGTAEGTVRKVATSTPLRMMLPVLRRRARRPRVLWDALVRLLKRP